MSRIVGFDTEFNPQDRENSGFISAGFGDMAGNTYYAVNADVDFAGVLAVPWLVDNVVPHLPLREDGLGLDLDHPDVKPLSVIREEIGAFLLDGEERAELVMYYGSQDMMRMYGIFGWLWDGFPRGLPTWFRELKAMLVDAGSPPIPKHGGREHHALDDALWNLEIYAVAHRWLSLPTWRKRLSRIWGLGFITSAWVARS